MGAAAGLVIGWARRGRVDALAGASVRALPLLGVGAFLVLLSRAPGVPSPGGPVLIGVGYFAALTALWLNRDRPWSLVVLVGAALNTVAILANGGHIPVAGAALPPLSYLGDSMRLEMGGRGVLLSPGDAVMAAGIAGFLQSAMCRPLGRAGLMANTRT